MTHDISLPYSQKPKFPPRCVVCECENPTAIADVKILIAARSQSLTEDAADLLLGTSTQTGNTRISIPVPACPKCKKDLKRWHFWKQVSQYFGPLTGVALMGFFLFKGLSILAFVALAAGILWPVIHEVLFPPAFTTTGSGRRIIYEFGSKRCSEEFAQLNQKRDDESTPSSPPKDAPKDD